MITDNPECNEFAMSETVDYISSDNELFDSYNTLLQCDDIANAHQSENTDTHKRRTRGGDKKTTPRRLDNRRIRPTKYEWQSINYNLAYLAKAGEIALTEKQLKTCQQYFDELEIKGYIYLEWSDYTKNPVYNVELVRENITKLPENYIFVIKSRKRGRPAGAMERLKELIYLDEQSRLAHQNTDEEQSIDKEQSTDEEQSADEYETIY